jgi:DNA-binding SARP family transcriptional activator
MIHFGLLGPLEVAIDGKQVDIGGIQPRTVLAVLLAAAARVVSADAIADAVWGDDAPASATGTLQSYVSRLRRVLEPGRGRGEQGTLLLYEPPGYRLAVPGDAVDFRRFEALADNGRALLTAGDLHRARTALTAAGELWRGPALAEFADHEFATGLATRLEERRLATLEDRMEAELAVGNHGAVVSELAELVTAHPLREGLRVHRPWASIAAAAKPMPCGPSTTPDGPCARSSAST